MLCHECITTQEGGRWQGEPRNGRSNELCAQAQEGEGNFCLRESRTAPLLFVRYVFQSSVRLYAGANGVRSLREFGKVAYTATELRSPRVSQAPSGDRRVQT